MKILNLIKCVLKKKSIVDRSKTCLWNFFECVEGMTYRCMFCSRQIAISHLRGVGNLRRHVMRIHKKQYEVIVKYAPDTDSLHRGRSGVFLKTISSGKYYCHQNILKYYFIMDTIL